MVPFDYILQGTPGQRQGFYADYANRMFLVVINRQARQVIDVCAGRIQCCGKRINLDE